MKKVLSSGFFRQMALVISFLFSSEITIAQANTWTWISGSNLQGQTGVYGSQGVPSVSNIPGSRFGMAQWKEGLELWLFGGAGNAGMGAGAYNDVWRYTPATKEWTWLKGSNIQNQPGVYGTKGITLSTNTPGARTGCSSWDFLGICYMFGGLGFGFNGSTYGLLNDVWFYNVFTNDWTWVKGSNTINQPGIYGTKGVSASSNTPGARTNATCWVDADGKFWLFGGYGIGASETGYLNDLWRFDPLTTTFKQ